MYQQKTAPRTIVFEQLSSWSCDNMRGRQHGVMREKETEWEVKDSSLCSGSQVLYMQYEKVGLDNL